MAPRAHRGILQYIVSPYGLAAASYLFFLFCCLLPPVWYKHHLNEPDLMFMDVTTILFYSLCVVCFLAGVRLVDGWSHAELVPEPQIETTVSPIRFVLVPVLITLTSCCVSIVLVMRNYPALVQALLSQSGKDIKGTDVGRIMPLSTANMWLLGIIWWATWRSRQLGIGGYRGRLLRLVLYIATLATIIGATLKLTRGELMLIVMSVATVYLLRRSIEREANFAFAARYSMVITACVLVLFFLFSFARGSDWNELLSSAGGNTGNALVTNLLTYTASSYNRLAALLHHRLRYPYAGRGIYLCAFLNGGHTFNRVIPFNKTLGWPDFNDVWQSEFGAAWKAGLNGTAITAGTFGYIFSELGWYAPLFVFAYGLMYGWVWRAVKMGKVFGVVLYPWFAFCILNWFGTNFLLDNKILIFFLTFLLLGAYERLYLRPRASAETAIPAMLHTSL